MDQTFYDKVIAHPGVHASVLELAKLEGQYAGNYYCWSPLERAAASAKIQTLIHDVIEQACRIGLRQGYVDGLQEARKLTAMCGYGGDLASDGIDAILDDPETLTRYVMTEAFK